MHGLLSGFWLLLLAGLCISALGDSGDVNDSKSAFRLAEDDLERLAEKLQSRSGGQPVYLCWTCRSVCHQVMSANLM